jgi:PilZ domain
MPSFGCKTIEAGQDRAAFGLEQSPPSGRRMDGLSGRRTAARERVVLVASAQAIDSARSVVIADLSNQGARLQGRDLPSNGREVLITTGSLAVFAVVAWYKTDECGLRFDPPLDHSQLRQLEHEGQWATVMGPI